MLLVMTTAASTEIITESLRTLRNCSGSNWAQNHDLWKSLLLETFTLIKTKINQVDNESDLIQLRVALQVVGNLLTAQQELTDVIWEHIGPHSMYVIKSSGGCLGH
jgi:hypothetical protein